jgi:hypothetical protein
VRSGIECIDLMMLLLGNWSHINTQTDQYRISEDSGDNPGDLQSRTAALPTVVV